MKSLDDFLDGTQDLPDDPTELEAWRIDGPSTAAWAMRKVASCADRMEENERLARERIAAVEAWLEQVNRPLVADREFFEHHLIAYARALREADPKRKTLNLPDGKVKTRAVPARARVVDTEAFLLWAMVKAPQLTKTTTAPRLSAINEHLAATGELPPGVEVDPEDVSFTVAPEVGS